MLSILLTCCNSIKVNDSGYTFPSLGEVSRDDDGQNIKSYDKDGNLVFYYDGENDTVTIPRWYWIKLLNYGINTGGILVE